MKYAFFCNNAQFFTVTFDQFNASFLNYSFKIIIIIIMKKKKIPNFGTVVYMETIEKANTKIRNILKQRITLSKAVRYCN